MPSTKKQVLLNRLQYVGQVINNKIILSYAAQDKKGTPLYKYKCSCGHIGITYLYTIKLTKTCKKCRVTRICKLTDIEAGFNRIFSNYKDAAIRRKLDFKISIGKFRELTSSRCYYCNSKPANLCKKQGKNTGYIYNGIDRLDNCKGYTVSNCVACCGKCNKAKLDMPIVEFKEHITKIYKHWVTK